jgi:hypothetical protein
MNEVTQSRVHHVLCSAYSDLMTDLVEYDALEVSAVAQEELTDGSSICEICPEEEADFWSVYAHCIKGGVICIGDFETRALAEAYADALSAKLRMPVSYR